MEGIKEIVNGPLRRYFAPVVRDWLAHHNISSLVNMLMPTWNPAFIELAGEMDFKVSDLATMREPTEEEYQWVVYLELNHDDTDTVIGHYIGMFINSSFYRRAKAHIYTIGLGCNHRNGIAIHEKTIYFTIHSSSNLPSMIEEDLCRYKVSEIHGFFWKCFGSSIDGAGRERFRSDVFKGHRFIWRGLVSLI